MSDHEIADMTIEQVRPLLTTSALPTDDLDPAVVELFGVREPEHGVVIACIGLERFGTEVLIRSLAVDADHRGSGIGASLVDEALRRAEEGEATAAYGVTTDAEAYLSRFGFDAVSRETLFGPITRSSQLQGACPDTATVMRRSLGRRSRG